MGSPKRIDVRDELRAAVEKAGDTLEGAELLLEVGRGYLSHLLAGKYGPGRAVAGRIQARYGVSVERWDEPKGRGKRSSERHQRA